MSDYVKKFIKEIRKKNLNPSFVDKRTLFYRLKWWSMPSHISSEKEMIQKIKTIAILIDCTNIRIIDAGHSGHLCVYIGMTPTQDISQLKIYGSKARYGPRKFKASFIKEYNIFK